MIEADTRNMNLIILIVLVLAGYLVYSTLESNRAMAREIRAIRLQCAMGTAAGSAGAPGSMVDPVESVKSKLLEGLQGLKGLKEYAR